MEPGETSIHSTQPEENAQRHVVDPDSAEPQTTVGDDVNIPATVTEHENGSDVMEGTNLGPADEIDTADSAQSHGSVDTNVPQTSPNTTPRPEPNVSKQTRKTTHSRSLPKEPGYWGTMRLAPPVPAFHVGSHPRVRIGKLKGNLRVRASPGSDQGNGNKRKKHLWIVNPSNEQAAPYRRKGDPVFIKCLPASDGGSPNFQRVDFKNSYIDDTYIELDSDIDIHALEKQVAESFYSTQMKRLTTYQKDLELWNARTNLYRSWFPPADANIPNVQTREEAENLIQRRIQIATDEVKHQHLRAEESDFDRFYNSRRREMSELQSMFLKFDEFRDIPTKHPLPAVQDFTVEWKDHQLFTSSLKGDLKCELLKTREDPNSVRLATERLETGMRDGKELMGFDLVSNAFIKGWGRKDLVENAPHLLTRVRGLFW